MPKPKELIDALVDLPCFNAISNDSSIEISLIEKGQSSVCFYVLFNQQRFFVKRFKSSIINAEHIATKHAAKHNLAPNVIYANDNWLVSEFIEGKSLNDNALTIHDNINTSIKLMVQCHKITVDVPVLDVFNTLDQYSYSDVFSKAQKEHFARVISTIKRSKVSDLVFCHGDINFSNVLVGDKSLLIDFECACLAEAEFDVAMFIAINALSKKEQLYTISFYEKKCNALLSKEKLLSYLQCSYLLNGLWYIERSRSEAKRVNSQSNAVCNNMLFETIGLKQFELFDLISPLEQKLVDVMR